jgi:hypothetical protein
VAPKPALDSAAKQGGGDACIRLVTEQGGLHVGLRRGVGMTVGRASSYRRARQPVRGRQGVDLLTGANRYRIETSVEGRSHCGHQETGLESI